MNVAIIIGVRPNFIKIAPLIEEMKHHRGIKATVIHTGQHYDVQMSEIFFKELRIPKPDYNLGVGSESHAMQTAKIMERLEPVLLRLRADWLLVMGDVNSTLAGALVASKIGLPIGHIEAGMRSFNKRMPEEINRIVTDHLSSLLFCPTKTSVANLRKEGITKGVYYTGDIMCDAFLRNIALGKEKSNILKKLQVKPKEYFLLTVHRAQNTEGIKQIKSILQALKGVSERIIFPVHPRTKKQMSRLSLFTSRMPHLMLIDPLSYLDMLFLEANAKKILTDSGGVQKEAYWAGIPCITLREETEWVESLRGGWNCLVGNDPQRILEAIQNPFPKTRRKNYFGNGKTAQKIIKLLEEKM